MYGLTGTLGSEDAKQLLCNVYSVDTIVVPRYKQIYHIELPSIIVNEEKEWIKTIVQSTVEEVRRNRAVLIICETRADAIAIFKQLRDKYLKVNLYTDNTDRNESNIVDNRAGGGDIIVATNLAGRGTDFKTSKEVEENGGLHVCLTFLPINPRVEQQAFGRTSRQGNRGTSQLILNIYDVIPRLPIYSESADEHSNLSIDNWQKIEYLRELCQKAETNQLKKILTEDIPEIKLKDELFRKFCELLHDLRQMDNDEYKLNSVKERWGLWLKDRDYRDRAKDSLITKIKKAGFQLIDDRSGSLYHAVSQQLQERIPDDKLEKQMIGHIIQNQRYYEDCLKNIDNDSRIFYIENTMMQALMRAIGINIVLFHSYEQLPTIYKRRNANKTIYLATDVDLSFYSFAVNDAENILNDMLARADQDEIVVNPNIIQNHNEDQLYVKLCNAFQQKDHLIDYSQFEQEIREQYQDGDKIIQNPFYHIAKADMLIEKTHKFTTRTKQFIKKVASFGFSKSIERKQALQCLDAAIQLDPIYSFTAYVNRAYLTIEQRNSPTYKENVIVDLTKARDQINNLILPVYHSMQLNLGNDNNEHLAHDELSKQLTIKTDIIQLYSSHIENAILKIEKSRKLVDITIFDKEKITTITKLERYKALELIGSYDSNKCKQFINYVLNHHKYKLSFHDLLVYKDIIKKDQAIKLIKLIKLMKKDYHNISINFQQIPTTIAKEVVQCCEKIVQHANLRVDYLNKEELFNLFDFVTDDERTIDVNITAKNLEQYRDIIQNINAIVIINTSIENGLKFSTNNNALDYLMNNVYQQIASITIPAANVQFFDALKIMSLDDISFSVIFNKLSLTKILNVIETVNKSISIEFTNFDIINAKKIIKIQKERNFLVCLNDLSYSETRQILEIFDPDEQDVNVIFKKIDENYLPNDKPEEELNELNKHGINKLIIINELTPIPWFSVMTIAALGTAQIIGGVLLSTFTCGIGFSLGASLIAEGVSDLYFALKGTISRNINWKDYAMQKAISLAICFLTLGASTVSQSFRAAEQFASKSTPQLAKQTWIQAKSFIQTSFTIIGEETIETTAKTSLRLACKKVAVMSIETGAREVLNYSADHILNNHLLTKIRLELADYIESSINEIMDKDSEYKLMLERIFFIDSYNQNHQWQYQIEQIAFNILNTCEEYINAAKSFAMGASNALLNHVKQNGGTPGKVWNITQKGLDVIKIIQQASKCTIFTKKFFHSFKNELKKLEEGMPELVELLSKEENIGLEAAKAIFLILKEHNIFNTDGSLNRDFFPEDQNENIIEKVITDEQIIDRSFSIKNLKAALQKIDFRINEEDYGSIVIKFFTRILHDAYQKSMLLKKIHKLLIDQMMAFIQGVFVAPLKNYIIRKVIQIVSDNLQRNLDENHATVQEQLEYQGALRYNNIILTKFIKDVQCGKIEMKSDAKEQFKRILQKPMKDRSQYENQIFKVLNNNQGGIVELHLISAVTGLKFSVIENKDSKEVVKHDGKIQLAYTQTISHEEDKTIVSSYWQPVGNHNSLNIEQRNNSLYDAVYAQIPNLFTSPAEIRIQVAEFMLTNPTYIAQILPAVNIINSNPNPIHRNKWLMEDGYFEISNTQIKPNLLYLQKSNSIGIRAVNAMKDLTDFINNYGEKITVAIDIGYRLFPRLIPREVVTMGNKFVVFNRRCTDIARRCNDVVGKCQKKAMIGALIELIRTGQIIISFCDELKS
jgi:hypothetical protein